MRQWAQSGQVTAVDLLLSLADNVVIGTGVRLCRLNLSQVGAGSRLQLPGDGAGVAVGERVIDDQYFFAMTIPS